MFQLFPGVVTRGTMALPSMQPPRNIVPTCRYRRRATWIVCAWALMICSTTSSPHCTTPPTAPPTPARCGWSGRASRCRAGPTATSEGAADALCRVGGSGPGAGGAAGLRYSCGRSDHRSTAARSWPPSPCPPPWTAVTWTDDDFEVSAGWGHFRDGRGRHARPWVESVERDYTATERAALGRRGI